MQFPESCASGIFYLIFLYLCKQAPDKLVTTVLSSLQNSKEHKSKINKIALHAIKIIIF
jgi:hypothetical protein